MASEQTPLGGYKKDLIEKILRTDISEMDYVIVYNRYDRTKLMRFGYKEIMTDNKNGILTNKVNEYVDDGETDEYDIRVIRCGREYVFNLVTIGEITSIWKLVELYDSRKVSGYDVRIVPTLFQLLEEDCSGEFITLGGKYNGNVVYMHDRFIKTFDPIKTTTYEMRIAGTDEEFPICELATPLAFRIKRFGSNIGFLSLNNVPVTDFKKDLLKNMLAIFDGENNVK